jgi:hypothetical protein
MDKKYYILDNIISKKDLSMLYNDLTSDNIWYISRKTTSTEVGHWPGFIPYDQSTNGVSNPYWFGRFVGIFENIKNNFLKTYNFELPPNIFRVHVGAKNDASNPGFHIDVEDASTYTIVGCLSPEWSKDWGGELNIEGETIDFIPGRFIIFKSNLRHNGNKVIKSIDFWKLSLNYVIKQ